MATTYTTNYNLGKQENHADKFDMDVITDNADKIDAALTAKADKSTTYTKTEVDTALSGKQATLTTAQLAAVNSGIDSAGVSQITTNKNNILFNTNNGVKNLLRFTSLRRDNNNYGKTVTTEGVKFTINDDGSITANRVNSSSNSAYVSLCVSGNDMLDIDEFCDGNHYLSGCPAGGSDSTYKLYAARSTYSAYDTGNGVLLNATSIETIYVNMIVYLNYNAQNLTFYPMISRKSIFEADPTWQPPTLSNAELTAKVKPLEVQKISSALTEQAAESYADGTVCGYSDSFASLSGTWLVIRTYTVNTDGNRKVQIVESNVGERKTRFFNGAWGAWS